jgi:hypothetical protein
MIIYVVYLCIDSFIIKIICRTFIVIILNKIVNYKIIYNTRNSTKLHVNFQRTNYRKYTVFNKGVYIWNCLNENIKNIKSYFSFKKKIKSYYLLSA